MPSFLLKRWVLPVFALVASTFSATAQSALPNGLKTTFFADKGLTRALLTRVDPTIDFNWDNQPPAPGLPAENYAVRWTGYLVPPQTGAYTLVVTADDGIRLWLDDKRLLNEWHLQEPTDYRLPVTLTAGRAVALRVEYYQDRIQARAQVRWLLPDDEQIAPEIPGLQAPTPRQISPRYLFQTNPTVPAPVASLPPPVAPPVTPPAPDSARTPMPELKSGVQFDLPNVYFETAKARLLPSSARSLDRLAEALQAQPELQIEISGHTDIVGDAKLNRVLSEERAARVVEYLTMRGIAPGRLTAIGYGATRPVARNNSPAERARNRRVEVMVR